MLKTLLFISIIYLLLPIKVLSKNISRKLDNDTINSPAIFLYEDGSLNDYIINMIELPIEANGIIYYIVEFTINCDSTISDISIKDVAGILCKQCELSLHEVLTSMPKWKPAINKGKCISTNVSHIIKIDLINPPSSTEGKKEDE